MADELRRMTRAELLTLLVEEKKKNEGYEQRYMELDVQSYEKDQFIKELNDRILSMQEQAADQTLKLSKTEEAQAVLKTQLETSKARQDELSQKNDKLRISLNEAIAENKRLSDELKISESDMTERANRISDLEESISRLQEELTDKDGRIEQLTEEAAAFEKEISELSADNEALVLRNKEADEKTEALSHEKQGLIDTVKALEAEKEALMAQTVKPDDDVVEALNRTLEEERAKNEQLADEIDELRTRLHDMSSRAFEEDAPNIVERMKSSILEKGSSLDATGSSPDQEVISSNRIDDPDIVSEASEKVSNIIKMAQQRAEQYLNEAKAESERQIRECNQMKAETLDKCRSLEKDKQRACESMIANVKQETEAVLNELYKRTRGISRSQDSLYQELLEKIIGLDVF
ncbi:hypothetical protein [Ruminococcus sp.]|uniref:hypothetical protein n=1 Tax=Ruminococcus sp. TaxID=41978 RepID=UPI003890F936